eukprot:471050_1
MDLPLTNHFESLSLIETSTRKNGIKLLLKIFHNILQHPTNDKYQDLSLKMILKRFSECKPCIDLLLHAGFCESDNKRLILGKNKLNKVAQVNQKLIVYNNQFLATHIENNDLSFEKEALQMSNQNQVKCNTISKVKMDLSPAEQLMSMGFDQLSSHVALAYSDGDVNLAAQLIIDDDKENEEINENENTVEDKLCNINQCKYAIILSELLKNYHLHDRIDKNYNIVQILNSFNHLLFKHSKSDTDFHILYKMFGGECDIENCNSIRRRHSDRLSIQYNIDQCNNDRNIFDTIHCHFQHSYDLLRLTPNEKAKIGFINDAHKDIFIDNDKIKINIINQRIASLCDILRDKKKIFTKRTKSQRYSQQINKFVTDLNQIKLKSQPLNNTIDEQKIILEDSKEDVDNMVKYSYSFDFNYWPHCKYSEIETVSGKMKNFYVPPKYNDMKQELLTNPIGSLPKYIWDNYYSAAIAHLQTFHCQTIVAKVDEYMQNYKHFDDHPSRFGFNQNDEICVQHLMSIMFYCDLDNFQQKFTETYRKGKTIQDIKKIHSNFHHFAKALREAVEVFGTVYYAGNIDKMYHGINQEMIFTGMQPKIHSILSTTASRSIAIQFTQNTGIVLQIIPQAWLKYFDCHWLSRYSNEQELLYIGGFCHINIVNIVNVVSAADFSPFIDALRIIDCMFNGQYFNYECSITHKIKEKQTYNIKSLGLSGIPKSIKILTIRLIQHELHKYESDQYPIYPDLHAYIDRLLHHICINKMQLSVDLNTMKFNCSSEFDRYVGGYIGYLFLRQYICSTKYEGLNWSFVYKLFPSVRVIYLYNLESITSHVLDDIWIFINSHPQSTVIEFELVLKKEKRYGNAIQQSCIYKQKFRSLDFEIGFDTKPDKCVRVSICHQSTQSKNTSNNIAFMLIN